MPAFIRLSTAVSALLLSMPAWAGSPKVTVINTAAAPALTEDVTNPALQPFQTSLLPFSTNSNHAVASFTVPAGKELVIEYTSAQAQDLTGGYASMLLYTVSGGVQAGYFVFNIVTNIGQINQQVRIYADPGSTVQAFEINPNGSGSCGGYITISGHLVDVPTPPVNAHAAAPGATPLTASALPASH